MENKATGQLPFFRADYNNEVEKIRSVLKKCNTFGNFEVQVLNNAPILKNVFQHIYTVDTEIFNKLKQSFSFHNKSLLDNREGNQRERERLFGDYYSAMIVKIQQSESQARPEFGACKECSKFLDKEQKKRYSKLKDVKEEFWDWAKW